MKRIKQILAIFGVVVIAGLYLITLLSAIFVRKITGPLFLSCIVATIMVPVLLYLVFWVYRIFRREEPAETEEDRTQKGFAEAASMGKRSLEEGKIRKS